VDHGPQHGIDHVIDVIKVAPLLAASVEFDGFSAEGLMDEHGRDSLPVVANFLTRTVGVR
jgi:hypothetical protein